MNEEERIELLDEMYAQLKILDGLNLNGRPKRGLFKMSADAKRERNQQRNAAFKRLGDAMNEYYGPLPVNKVNAYEDLPEEDEDYGTEGVETEPHDSD